jgi:DNA helicase HerA-like ATPase
MTSLSSHLDQEQQYPSSGIIGHVLSVRGAFVRVGLPAPMPAGAVPATVGSFLGITTSGGVVVGVISQVDAEAMEAPGGRSYQAVAQMELMGELRPGLGGRMTFSRGVRGYPGIGEAVTKLTADDLAVIYRCGGRRTATIGALGQDGAIPATVDVDGLLTKHFAILGSTGVGKSSGVAVLIDEIVNVEGSARVLILDSHNEYGRAFGQRAYVTGADDLRLPFWLFNFEEFVDVLYGGRPAVQEEVDILAELIPQAKGTYAAYKNADRSSLTRRPRQTGFTADTPTPYLLQDLTTLIDERMGKLENRANRMTYHRLMTRIDAIKNDPRYAFMFENANVGGDTMAQVLSRLFRLERDNRPITVLRLASLPGEAVDAVVCVTLRLAFEFGMWSDGALPLLIVCEEAHRYAARDHSVGFGPARRSLARIAKEGRKYGVHLGLVSQRPAELDPTIISQCSTLFAMRMTNDEDQALLRSAITDATTHLIDIVPSLATGEVVGLGEGMPLPARFMFRTLANTRVPRSEIADRRQSVDIDPAQLVKTTVDLWRRATAGSPVGDDDSAPVGDADRDARAALRAQLLRDRDATSPATNLLEQARSSLLQR